MESLSVPRILQILFLLNTTTGQAGAIPVPCTSSCLISHRGLPEQIEENKTSTQTSSEAPRSVYSSSKIQIYQHTDLTATGDHIPPVHLGIVYRSGQRGGWLCAWKGGNWSTAAISTADRLRTLHEPWLPPPRCAFSSQPRCTLLCHSKMWWNTIRQWKKWGGNEVKLIDLPGFFFPQMFFPMVTSASQTAETVSESISLTCLFLMSPAFFIIMTKPLVWICQSSCSVTPRYLQHRKCKELTQSQCIAHLHRAASPVHREANKHMHVVKHQVL